MQTYSEKIHSYNANEARVKQRLDFEDSLQWSDRIPPTPRAYIPAKRNLWGEIKEIINITKYLP